MLPTITLKDFITNEPGTSVRGQVNEPSYLSGKSLTCTVQACTSNVRDDLLCHARNTSIAIDSAISHLSGIIGSHIGDAARVEKIVEHMDLLKKSELSFATGYGGNSVWVQGKGIKEEWITEEQDEA